MRDGILAASVIQQERLDGNIEIEPFDEKQLNSTSYDLRLGDQVRLYTDVVHVPTDSEKASRGIGIAPGYIRPLDAKRDNPTQLITMSLDGFLLVPNVGYLFHTVERIKTDHYRPIVDGKSSIGRLFISVHETAGYGDPGFDGQYTLEVTSLHPVTVYPGMRIAQISFETIVGTPILYKGNYTGATSKGPVASRSFKQFDRKTPCASSGCGGFARPDSRFCSKDCREATADGTC